MLALRLSPEIEQRLEALARKTGRTKSYYAKKAITEFLQDEEDYLLALTRLEENNPRLSLEDIERQLGLES
jgi:RHH-type rel operon transcriptional repressor/antitoxin RelB